jgi:hypothetical protein
VYNELEVSLLRGLELLYNCLVRQFVDYNLLDDSFVYKLYKY